MQPRYSCSDTNRASLHCGSRHSRQIQSAEPSQFASSNGQFCNPSHARNFTARQIALQIEQMFLEILDGYSLRRVVGKLFQVPQPHVPVLPVNIAGCAHNAILLICLGGEEKEGNGAGDEIRTRDINLGKVALYQLSYSRVGAGRMHKQTPQAIVSPTAQGIVNSTPQRPPNRRYKTVSKCASPSRPRPSNIHVNH